MSLDPLIETWKDVREGLIAEVSKIPADKFDFKAAPDARTVAEIVQHIIGAQALLVGEMCRPDTDLRRAPFPELIKQYAPEAISSTDKDVLLSLLASGQEAAAAKIRAFGEEGLREETRRFDGKMITKVALLQFSYSHEMYHRGQLTVYERLMSVEPALTTRLNDAFKARS